MMHIAIVVAVARNGVIGRDNALPWRLPDDLKHFKRTTMSHPIIMGRVTFESLGKPLPGRTNIVVTRQKGWHAEGVERAHDLDSALSIGREIAVRSGREQLMIIGGAQLYREVLPRCSRIYLTEVHADVEGDAHFPELDRSMWREESREDFPADGGNAHDYSFVVLGREP